MTSAFDAWISRARSVPIECALERRGIKLRGTTERCGSCPKCGGDDRFSINVKKQIFNCRGCGVGGDVIKLIEHLDGVDFIAACTTLAGETPPKNVNPNGKDPSGTEPKKVVAAEYPYQDESGALVFVVERVEYQNPDGTYVVPDRDKRKKTFRQKRPDPDKPGRWIWNIDGVPVIPYRLPEVIEAVANEQMILIVEGEAKADLLWSWNVPATCCAGGAKKWKPEHAKFLRGADVVILPDNDAAGRRHVDVVATSLASIAASRRTLELPNLPPKGDIIDWAKASGSVEKLHDLIAREAATWTAHICGVENLRNVLYRETELIEDIANGHSVIIVGSGRDVDMLREQNIPATCSETGWQKEVNEIFRNANVVLIPDSSEAGWKHINDIGANLYGIAASIRVLLLPNVRGTTTWFEAGGTRDQLLALMEGAADWVKPAIKAGDKAKATAQEDELLEALARMRPGIERDRRRAQLAKEFGVSRGAIDDELEARRAGNEKPAPLHGHWIVEPWPEVVDGDALLRDIIQRIRRHVVCSHDDALAIALWIMMAWVHDEVATHSPILNINSAEPESGKSTTLGLVSFLAPRCVSSVEISEAALYRAIQLWQPSFVIDEFDSVLASEDKTALRSVINSGHTRGQGVVRCVEPDFRPQLFKTFCPKAIGMVGRKLPATTLSRCIIIELRRRKISEPIERFGHKDDAELAQLRSRLLRWSTDNEDILRNAKPSMPEAFDNRRADNWRVMLAIADLAGDDWGDRARQAATKLEGASDTTTIGVRLLADIKRIFDEDGVDCMLSAALVERLKADEEGPWSAWAKGKGLTQNALATLLSGGGGRARGSRGGFGIRSETVHPSRDIHGRGYKRTSFEDAWARYLPAEISSSAPEEAE